LNYKNIVELFDKYNHWPTTSE